MKLNSLLLIFICFVLNNNTTHTTPTRDTINNSPSKYLINIQFEGLGNISCYLTFQKEGDNKFTGFSNPDLIYHLLPIHKRVLFRVFNNSGYKGAVITVKGSLKNDTVMAGKAETLIGKFQFHANIIGEQIKGSFKNKETEIRFSGKSVENMNNLRDYSALNNSLKNTIEKQIYKPSILKRPDWKYFLRKMDKKTDKCRDDLDFLVMFLYLKRKLETSHVFLTRENPYHDKEVENISTKEITANTALLKIDNFSLNDTSTYKKFISKYNEKENLIIDLRECGGGDISSIILASHFIEDPKYVGYFLSNKYWTKKESLPDSAYLYNRQSFTKGSLEDFFKQLEQDGILLGKAIPQKPVFNGNIFVLTSEHTASAAEPFCHFIKTDSTGTLIGKKTAGKMLSAKPFELSDNWFLVIPVAGFYTMDGISLEQRGVEPHISIKAENSLEYIRNWLNTKENQ